MLSSTRFLCVPKIFPSSTTTFPKRSLSNIWCPSLVRPKYFLRRRFWPSTLVNKQAYHKEFIKQNGPVFVSRQVAEAIEDGRPVVALESTIITHGMKYPHNLETALQVESIIRHNGSLPATIAVLDGNVFVGLQHQQLEQLAERASDSSKPIFKVSRSDLPSICALKHTGGTTVSATSYLANLVGIRVFVTGGIGGVHRGAEVTMDISADLTELSRTPITVVSAGIKSILDIGKTLEVLETNGVCVAVYNGQEKSAANGRGQVQFPAFFTPDSGISVNYNFKTPESVAQLIHMRDELNLECGILLAVPNCIEEGKIYQNKLEAALDMASSELRQKEISGKSVTPYLLSRISELTGGESLKLNQQLIANNARVGAAVSVAYSKTVGSRNAKRSRSSNPPSNSGHTNVSVNSNTSRKDGVLNPSNDLNSTKSKATKQAEALIPVVIGGSIYDIITKANQTNIKLDGSTYSGTVQTSLGGVARNIWDAISGLGQNCLFITAVGDDQRGQLVASNSANKICDGIRVLNDIPTSACCVAIDGNGECLMVLGDFRAHQFVDQTFVSQFECRLSQAPIVIIDANIPDETINYVLAVCGRNRVPVWYEPTDLNLVWKLFKTTPTNMEAIKFISPNFNELQAIYRGVLRQDCCSNLLDASSLHRKELIKLSTDYGTTVMEHFRTIHALLITLGKHGALYLGRDTADLETTISLGPNSSLFNKHSQINKPFYLAQNIVDQVVNVSGAGDCMVGAIVYGFLNQKTIRESLQLGLQAAHLSVNTFDTIPSDIGKILESN